MPKVERDIFEGTEFNEDGTEVGSEQEQVVQDEPEQVVEEKIESQPVEKVEEFKSRDDLRKEALSDGESDAVIEELSEKETVTVADLRRIPGTKDLSDKELTAMWARFQKQAKAESEGKTVEQVEQEEKVQVDKPAPKQRGFKIYGDKDNEITDFTGMTVEQILDSVKFGYTALGKEQRKTLEEVLRNASLGHYNEQQMAGLRNERNSTLEKFNALDKEHKQWENERKLWGKALESLSRGDDKPIKAIANAYIQAMQAQPEVQDTSVQDAELEREGIKFRYEVLVPTAHGIAEKYGAKADEVLGAIEYFLQQEPVEFMTKEKYESIINIVVPSLLEQNGYKVKVANNPANTATDSKPAGDPRDAKIAELERQLNEISAAVKNNKTQTFGQKAKKAPGAGGGQPAPAGEVAPSFKSREQMKEWLRSR